MAELEGEAYEQANATAIARYKNGGCIYSKVALTAEGLTVQGFRAGICVVDGFGGTAIVQSDGRLTAYAATNDMKIINQFINSRGLQ